MLIGAYAFDPFRELENPFCIGTIRTQTLTIHRYELFNLRDADSSQNDIFYQFGLLRDDYSPKPAFAVFKKLVAELSL